MIIKLEIQQLRDVIIHSLSTIARICTLQYAAGDVWRDGFFQAWLCLVLWLESMILASIVHQLVDRRMGG